MIKKLEWYDYYLSDKWILVNKVWRVVKPLKARSNKEWKHYMQYWLWDWSYKKVLVHRLVAEYFIWDIVWKVVCHKDDNPENNSADNLFIWSNKDNSMDAVSKWRIRHKISYEQKQRMYSMFDEWLSNRVIWKAFNISNVAVHKIRHKRY